MIDMSSCLTPYSEEVLKLAAALYDGMRLEKNGRKFFVGVYRDGGKLFNVRLDGAYSSVHDAINSQEFPGALANRVRVFKPETVRRLV